MGLRRQPGEGQSWPWWGGGGGGLPWILGGAGTWVYAVIAAPGWAGAWHMVCSREATRLRRSQLCLKLSRMGTDMNSVSRPKIRVSKDGVHSFDRQQSILASS